MNQPTVSLSAPLCLSRTAKRREYTARLVRAGRIRNAAGEPGPFIVSVDAIRQAINEGKFTGLATFVDHSNFFASPSLNNLAGITMPAVWNPEDQSADATIRLYDSSAGLIVGDLLDQVIADAKAGAPIPDVGLSLVFYPEWQSPPDNPNDPLVLARFRHVESVDFVFQPAADGRITEALTALSALAYVPQDDLLGEPILGHTHTAAAELDASCPNPRTSNPNEGDNMPEERVEYQAAPQSPPADNPPPGPGNEHDSPATDAGQEWLDALTQATTDAMIAGSGLPPAAQARLLEMDFTTPQQVSAAVELQRQILADLHADDVVNVGNTPPRGQAITMGPNSMDQVQLALDALIEGVHPPDGIRPLTGIRELYTLLSGDYEMTGRYHADRVYLANVTSATMAGLVANALNKRVINLFMQYPRWWEPFVTEEDFSNLQQVRWITLGGVGELPTVAEGAAYTELTWDDQTETADFVKKGGYLGLTLEAMDKDDTNRIRAAPRALAQAAWLTLGKTVSAIFTDNSGIGPTMADTGALFNATAVTTTGGHANLLTAALGWAEWNTVRVAMMKQPELNSDERLGALTAPKYCLVPIDLEATALQILASQGEPGTADNDENIYAEGNTHSARMRSARERVIVIPLWTDTNNWAAVADPNMYPSIGIGYRYGRTPEIFSVASPTAGLMFSNDTMPVKVRFFYAVGPTDWRGLHKSNVA